MSTTALPVIEERQIDGNYGEIFVNGHYQGDIRSLTGRIAIERREIPRAGTNGLCYRRGRISRDGTITIGKVDSRFEALIMEYTALTEEEKRRRRGQGIPTFPDSELMVKLDDPDSWGAEEIQLFNVKFWEIGVGFTPNDLLERDMPITWTAEKLVSAIPRPNNKQGEIAGLPVGDITTYPAAGRDPNPVF